MKYNRDNVLEKIKILHKNEFVNSAYIQKHYGSLFYGANKLFGSWKGAVESAEINYDEVLLEARKKRIEGSIKWNKEKVVKSIKKMQSDNFDLSYTNLKENNQALLNASIRLFKTWENAVEAANIDYNDYRRKKVNGYWDEEKIKKEIEVLISKNTSLNFYYIYQNHNDLLCGSRRIFGSWENALNELGIDYEKVRKKQKDKDCTKEEIIRFVKQLYTLGKELNARSMQRQGFSAIYNQGIKKFGSWKKAIEACELNYDEIQKGGQTWSKEKVIKQIKELYENGEPLNSRYVRKFHRFLYNAKLHFNGSWKQAVIEAGIDYKKVRKEPEKEMILGKAFEFLCNKMFVTLKYHYIYQPRFEFSNETCIPDFLDNKNRWIECKLNSWTSTIESSLKKYLKYTDFVKIIYLKGNVRASNETSTFVPIDDYYGVLKEEKLGDLIEEFENLKENILPKDF